MRINYFLLTCWCISQSLISLIDIIKNKLIGNKNILIDSTELTLTPFTEPIEKRLKKDPNVSIYYSVKVWPCWQSFKDKSNLIQKRPIILNSVVKHLPFIDIYITPHIYANSPKKSVKIHISHNQPVKYTSYPKELFAQFDYHFMIGELHYRQTLAMLNYYNLSISQNGLLKVGYPKSDILYKLVDKKNKIQKELGLDPKKLTVIYAPSWEAGLSLREQGYAILNELKNIDYINPLIKLHPVSFTPPTSPEYDFFTGGIDWLREIKNNIRNTNIKNIVDKSSERYLVAADIMITDISGIALEFISLGKPVIYIRCPKFFNLNRKLYGTYGDFSMESVMNNPLSNAGYDVGYQINDASEIPRAIEYVKKHPNFKLKSRLDRMSMLRYNPGKATKAAYDAIISILKESLHR